MSREARIGKTRLVVGDDVYVNGMRIRTAMLRMMNRVIGRRPTVVSSSESGIRC